VTYRERREARAARLSEWAAKRVTTANAALESQPELRHDWAFITQPGHIPERARMNARDERAFESLAKARAMTSRAFGINDQLDRSIYSDDPDAIERLEARILELEAKRVTIKAHPHQAYELSNLSADIRRNKQRLESIKTQATSTGPQRVIAARRDGQCERCGESITAGQYIGKYSDGWILLKSGSDTWEPNCEVQA